MPIKPEDVNPSTLPVSLRGYQRDATDELLMGIAHDYRKVVLAQESSTREEKRLSARIAELEAELAASEARFDQSVRERTQSLADENARLLAAAREHESREELTRSLVASAQRSARELRESTRAECEALVKAAQRRAAEIEEEARSSVRSSAREVQRLRKLEDDLKAQLQRTLESVLGRPSTDRGAPVD